MHRETGAGSRSFQVSPSAMGLFESVEITRWRKAFFNHECLVPLD
ncbi:MAG: hypothetical protein R3F11_26580 [Verrucomicrobiales bacterium]